MDRLAKKYYVVWKGRRPGIYMSWEDCKRETEGFPGAKFKSFKTRKEAEEAFSADGEDYLSSRTQVSEKGQNVEVPPYIEESVSVDAACSGNPGPMEYRGVYTKDGRELFHYGPVAKGTNNIGEFLAIVHALALLKKKNSNLPIYSDSEIAIGWVKQKKLKSTLPRDSETEQLWNLIDRAEAWLRENNYENPLYKWDTKNWGEIKADFGRK